MSDDRNRTEPATETDAREDPDVTPEGAAPRAPDTEAPEAAAVDADEAARLAQEAAELKDRLLRTMAELENFRRRAERERQDTAKFAISKFARDCLPVLDNLRRGLDSVPAEERAASPALEALAAGMELTEREMLATLERHGITRIDPQGQPFDHDFHQAMFEIEDTSVPQGTVVQVMQAGYVLNERLLRPAMVGVSRGGPRPGEAPKEAPVQAPIANEDVAQAERAAGSAAGAPKPDPHPDPEPDPGPQPVPDENRPQPDRETPPRANGRVDTKA